MPTEGRVLRVVCQDFPDPLYHSHEVNQPSPHIRVAINGFLLVKALMSIAEHWMHTSECESCQACVQKTFQMLVKREIRATKQGPAAFSTIFANGGKQHGQLLISLSLAHQCGKEEPLASDHIVRCSCSVALHHHAFELSSLLKQKLFFICDVLKGPPTPDSLNKVSSHVFGSI